MDQELVICGLCGRTRSRQGYHWLATRVNVNWIPGGMDVYQTRYERLDPCLACLTGRGHLEGSTVGELDIDGRIANLGRYGLSLSAYAAMLIAQDGRCKICRDLPQGQSLAVDHDHDCCPAYASQKITCGKCNRGLLCKRCNTGIGYFLDEPARLLAAAKYLAAWQVRT